MIRSFFAALAALLLGAVLVPTFALVFLLGGLFMGAMLGAAVAAWAWITWSEPPTPSTTVNITGSMTRVGELSTEQWEARQRTGPDESTGERSEEPPTFSC